MAVDFGTDVSTFPDLDVSFGAMTGNRVVAEACARRLTTPRGTLVDDPNYGYDLRQLLNAGFTPSTQPAARAAIEAECRQDQRVQDASAEVVLDAATQTLSVRIALTTANGTFSLVLAVTAVTVSLLKVA